MSRVHRQRRIRCLHNCEQWQLEAEIADFDLGRLFGNRF
jgi:hypothetical protein